MADGEPARAPAGFAERYRARVAETAAAEVLDRRGAVLIEGVRWCGKTWTGLRLSRSALRLDRDEDRVLADIDPAEALRGTTPRLLDEWQNVPRLWNRVRHECDIRAQPGQFVLTGSASPHEDITRHTGTGRIGRVRLRPMSLFETGASDGSVSLSGLFCGEFRARQARPDVGLRDIASHICVGGWPQNLGVSEETAIASVRDHLTESVMLDVATGSGVRHDRESMLALVRSLARCVATEARVSTLVADMGADDRSGGGPQVVRQTATAYLAALRRIFLLEEQPAWAVHLRSRATLRKAPKRHFVCPSLAAAALVATPQRLVAEPTALGSLFESLAVRDLRIYAQPQAAAVYHYRDSDDLEVDAIVARDDGAWLAVEVKLGHRPDSVDGAAANLQRLAAKLAARRRGEGAGLLVLTALGPAYRRPDGVYVAPITALGP